MNSSMDPRSATHRVRKKEGNRKNDIKSSKSSVETTQNIIYIYTHTPINTFNHTYKEVHALVNLRKPHL